MNADGWAVLELAQPWHETKLASDPRLAPAIALLKKLFFQRGLVVQPVLIAPDSEYSRSLTTRVLFYSRPQPQFAYFEKQEFVVPEAEFPALLVALLKRLLGQFNELERFDSYRQETGHVREILVCTHGNVDAACARFGYPIYQQLRNEYAARSPGNLRVWRCSHFGGHRFAPTLIDLPEGRAWGHLEPEIVDRLIRRFGEVTELRSHYRGWSGLSKFEQVAEREIWMQVGWDWLSFAKSGRTTRKGGLTGIRPYVYQLLRWIPLKRIQVFLERWTQNATWADVEISFISSDGTTSGIYTARVEESDRVTTAPKSAPAGEPMQLQSVPQYRVHRLTKQEK